MANLPGPLNLNAVTFEGRRVGALRRLTREEGDAQVRRPP
jgi:hypothetical protein